MWNASIRRWIPQLTATVGLLFLASCKHAADPSPPAIVLPTEQGPLEIDGHQPIDISKLLERHRSENGLPALAGGLVIGDTVVAIGATGERQAASENLVELGDKWHLGSVTKQMTSTLTAILIENGVLTWETTVGDVFADVELAEEWSTVTVLDLTRQRGGVLEIDIASVLRSRAKAQKEFEESLPPKPSEERLQWVLDIGLKTPPDTRKFRYTNGNYIVLGAMLEKLTGESWETLMQTHLFQPLGLSSAGFGAPMGSDQPWGHLHAVSREPIGLVPGPFADNTPLIGPAGTVHMSLPDFARYARAQLDLARGESPLWSGESFPILFQHPNDGDNSYASGWVIEEKSTFTGKPLVHHNGSNGFWLAKIGLETERDMAFICATNYFARGQADRVCGSIFGELSNASNIEQLPTQ